MSFLPALVVACSPWLLAQVPPPDSATRAATPTATPRSTSKPAVTDPRSTTDRIARLVLSLESDRQQLDRLKTRIDDPDSEYRKAQASFKELDAGVAASRRAVLVASVENQPEEAGAKQAELEELEQDWGLARERFTIAIEERKNLQDKALALQQKIEQDQKALDQLAGPTPAHPEPAVVTPPPTSPPALAAVTPSEPGKTPGTAEPKVANKVLVKARQEAQAKGDAARAARAKADSINQRLTTLRANLEFERSFLETARKKAALARETKGHLEKELAQKGADPKQVAELRPAIAAAQKRLDDAQADIQASTGRIEDLATDLAALQNEQAAALAEAENRRREAEDAEGLVSRLQNPYTLANILQWLIDHGPRLLLILGGMWLLNHLVKLSSRRIVQVMVSSSSRGSDEERENRAQTLVGVFRNVAALAILAGGLVMLLDAVSVPIVPLMGGVAVIGLAVAFGAQNLIRDYFSGFMVLLENQYGINDVVKINGTGGKVEYITLRMTVLRDAQGIAHFIPHGTITSVSNYTHGYSLAHFELGVGYKEDVDRVMRVLVQLGKELREDPDFGPRILEDPDMLGVDSFSDSAVMIRFTIKTRPLQQWSVRRELLRRIKYRFDELRIELPFPQRTVHVYQEELAHSDEIRAAA